MKRLTFAALLATAFMATPVMAHDDFQHNMPGRYQHEGWNNNHGKRYRGAYNNGEPIVMGREAIRSVQIALDEAGYNTGKIDGVLGHQTRSAIAAFQRDHHLKGSGYLTERTLKLLDVVLMRDGDFTPKQYR